MLGGRHCSVSPLQLNEVVDDFCALITYILPAGTRSILANRWEALSSVPASFLSVLYPKNMMSSAREFDYLGLIPVLKTEADIY